MPGLAAQMIAAAFVRRRRQHERLASDAARRSSACRSRPARRAARSGRRCSSSVAVDRPSPTSSMRSPTTATTTSAASRGGDRLGDQRGVGRRPGTTTCGRGWPSGKNSPSGSAPSVRMSAPRACVTVQPSGTWARKPSSTVCDHLARVAVGQPVGLAGGAGPVAELGVRVVGVRADDGDRARGRRRRPDRASGSVPSLRSSTSERRATSRLSSACSALPMTAACRAASGARGFSNRPSSNFSVRMRPTAASRSASSSRPSRDGLLRALEEARAWS